jgi:heme A synthase
MMRELLKGAFSGALATAAMSGVMVAGERAGLMRGQPPKHITRGLLPGAKRLRKPGEGILGALAHFGFGAGAGAVFGLVSRDRVHRVPLGVGYALAIWAVSYSSVAPRLSQLPPISRDDPGRPLVMAAGHVVYGATLAFLLNRLAARERAGAARPYLVVSEPVPPVPAHR